MLSALFNGTTIPVLEQVVNFAQARHEVLAGNVANIDTPGYRMQDLNPTVFQTRLEMPSIRPPQTKGGGMAVSLASARR